MREGTLRPGKGEASHQDLPRGPRRGTRELWKELAPAAAPSSGRITALTIAPDVGAYAYTFSESLTTLYEVRGLQ